MNNKIPCDMIQDLLPLYVEGLTRKTTSKEIEGHLEACSRCRESHEQMKASMEAGTEEQKQEAERELDYLKTVRRKNIRNIILGAAAVFVVMAAAIGVKLFFTGSPTDSYVLTYLETDGEGIHVGGTFYGSASVYAGHKLVKQPDGTQKLVVYACLASAWNRQGVFNLDLDLASVERQIEIGGAVVMKDGTVISRLANELYRARNPYVGDAPADGRLAGTLEIARRAGNFTNELRTSSEPYGWTLHFQDSVRNSQMMEADMKSYACVLLALTDNLGEVAWTYTVETAQGTAERRGGLTEQEASGYLEEDVKAFGASPRKVQELLDLLGLN